MIIEKLSKIKLEAKNKIKREYRKIETVKNFKKLLNQIDFSAELVPTEDSKKLTKVLTSLKGKALNESESKLIEEIIKKNDLIIKLKNMKKIAYTFMIIATVLISKNINAQDKIFLKSGDKIEVKIIEVNIDNIKYKNFSNLNGPVFTIPKKDIHMVEYENGESDIFKEETIGFRRNRINVDVLAYMYNGPLSISYERLNESGKIGYEIPINLHMYEGEFVGITTGLNIKYYVSGSAKGFYVGPTLSLGVFDYYYEYGDYYFDYDTVFSVVPGVKLGYQFQLSNLFGLSLGGTVGYVIPFESNYQGDIAYSINFGLNFSLRKK